ncbi:MAG TPA: GGDEF domain-containing protein [Candidatus Acidoferrales bacterium]|nr:GGDEF domain-containing protein [Candidatus Acidoferrales bacterium]
MLATLTGDQALLGGVVGKGDIFWAAVHRFRVSILWALGAGAFFLAVWMLRLSGYRSDLFVDTYLQMAGGLVAFTFAANALVRFRGTHDRVSLILAFGFVLAALIEAATAMSAYRESYSSPMAPLQVSMAWMAGRSLLAVLLIVALGAERKNPIVRDTGREIAAATLLVGGTAYLISVIFFTAPPMRVHTDSILPRPWDLMLAVLFLISAVGYSLRLRRVESAFDRSLYFAAVLNVACHIAASESQTPLDAPYMLSHFLMVASYAIVLGGTLLENAHLFDEVSRLAKSDSLTGLANHRRLIEVLDAELQRSGRTGRRFSVLLLDLDGLKKINDRLGHLVGSRAIQRVGHVLRTYCRASDTAARYGGDEFALVLPEAGEDEALQAAARICEHVGNDGEKPVLSISVGVAVYPRDGTTIERLLSVADHNLYDMKLHEHRSVRHMRFATGHGPS